MKAPPFLRSPKRGQAVTLWYAKERAAFFPFHGMAGVVVIAGRGKPRNHLIRIGGALVVVPGGNVRGTK